MTRHVTTRPAYILTTALLVLLLVPVWAALGVFESKRGAEEDEGAGGGAMMMMSSDVAKREFGQKVQAFMAANTREDGCVVPTMAGAMATEMVGGVAPQGQGMEMRAAEPPAGRDADDAAVPVAYLQALRFGYLPAKLCLQSGKLYELRLMATDVTHGASLQLGPGSKMIRLPPGVLVTERLRFTRPGEYLLYCTFYCGLGHQYMQARIVVEAPGDGRS